MNKVFLLLVLLGVALAMWACAPAAVASSVLTARPDSCSF